MSIQILIADDHPLIRAGIQNELSHHDDIEIVGTAINGDEVISLTKKLQPDVILLDVNMPGPKAPLIVQEIKESIKTCRVLVLTAYGDSGTVRGMLRAGADGYILKDEDPGAIPDAIRVVSHGGTWFSPQISRDLTYLLKGEKIVGQELTPREKETLQLIVEGHTNKEIALQLQTSERTVEFHVGNILQKFGVRNRLEIVIWAKEHGMI